MCIDKKIISVGRILCLATFSVSILALFRNCESQVANISLETVVVFDPACTHYMCTTATLKIGCTSNVQDDCRLRWYAASKVPPY